MEDVFRGKNSPELQNVVWDLASNANVHLEHARSLRKTVPVVRPPLSSLGRDACRLMHTQVARSALLSGAIAGQWLSRLQQCDFGAYSQLWRLVTLTSPAHRRCVPPLAAHARSVAICATLLGAHPCLILGHQSISGSSS